MTQKLEQGKNKGQELPTAPSPSSRKKTIFTILLLAPGAGLVASLLAVVVMGILRLYAGIPTPMELFGDFFLKRIDVYTFLRLLQTFAPNSKTEPLGLALLGMIAIGTLLSLLYAALVRVKLPVTGFRPGRREWLVALGFALVMTLLGTILFWNELRQNAFGLPVDSARTVAILALLGEFTVYAVSLCLAYRALLPKQLPANGDKLVYARRQWLTRGGIAALTLGSGAATVSMVREYLKGYTSYDGIKTRDIIHPITPNEQHYVVTQNAVDPSPDTTLWRLEVTGLVKQPGSYTYEEVQKLPSTSRAITLECIAAYIGDHLLGNAIWHGVSLRTLLDLHGGAMPNASHVAFYSVDGYNISLPLNEVLAADTLLAWRMNGAEIPQRHGYPMRVLIPGRYGEENPKWLTRVELTDHFVPGLYSSQGWYNGQVHTISRIDRPRGTIAQGQPIEIGGIAFAGNRGIQKVEISVDAGTTWQQAQLDPPTSPDSWVFWHLQWQPTRSGSYTLVSRATDGTGELQTSAIQGTAPGGATGYHKIGIIVA